MITHIIHSHTDYLDVLKLQADCMSEYKNKILLINESDIDDEVFNQFDQVIYYNNSAPYASRFLALTPLNTTIKYVIIHHENQLVFHKDESIIELMSQQMVEHNIDRIDLRNDTTDNIHTSDKIHIIDDLYLNRQLSGSYLFNVGAAIWNLNSYLLLMSSFQSQSYREIEMNVQGFCRMHFRIYKTYSQNKIRCGYLDCQPYYQFLHVSHGNRFIPSNPLTLSTPDKYNHNMDQHIIDRWMKLIDKHDLKNGHRPFRNAYEDV